MHEPPSAIFDVMSIRAPAVTPAEAEAVARRHWGLAATAVPLAGERDSNFRLRAADGRDYVLKFANAAEDAAFRAMQLAALRHIAARDPGFAVPRVVALPGGADEVAVTTAGGTPCQVRLLTWVEGLPIGQATPCIAQREAFGRAMARLQAALEGFRHPGSANRIVWDVQHSLCMREVAPVLPPALRAVLLELLDAFEAQVTPALPRLRRQVLHSDLNRANVLVDPAEPARILGVIDFGDMAETAIVCDVAIAGTSQRGRDMGIAEAAGHMLRAYTALRPMPPGEIALLPLLMATRAVMSIVLACWHSHAQPGNPHYDVSERAIRDSLDFVAELRDPATQRALRHAAGAR